MKDYSGNPFFIFVPLVVRAFSSYSLWFSNWQRSRAVRWEKLSQRAIFPNLFICLTKSVKATRFEVGWSGNRQSYFLAKIQLFWHKATRNFLMKWIWRLTNYTCLYFVSNFALA